MFTAIWTGIKVFFGTHSNLPMIIVIGVMLAFSGFMTLKVKILTLERDKAETVARVAQATLMHQQLLDAAEIAAITQARKDDHDRQQFIQGNNLAIAQGRRTGDGPVAPVLRDALVRLHARYAAGPAAAVH